MELHVDKLLQQARTMDRSSRQPLRKPKDIAEIKPLEPFLRDPAVKKCLEEEIETAITADELYQRAIGAEEQAEWAFVVEQYGRILGDGNQAGSYPLGYRDVQTRLAYARGRAAEVEEDWPRALESYERLDADSFDVALRRPYVCARQAEVDGRWSLAEEVYGEIAEHQDVPLRLPYARARAAAERQDWLGVMQALVGLPFAERDVETWWQTALGQVDEQVKEQEEAGDWPAAHEIYRRLRKALGRRCGKEIKQRQAYAGARAAEQDRSWPVALKKLKQRALRGYLDVEARKAYAQGRVAEEEGQWQKAISAYQTLDGTPQGTGKGCDVAKRLLYAHGRQAELEEDWPAVVSGFGTLPDSYPDGAGDVGRRRRHARGRREDAAGRWAGVVEALEDLDDSYRDGAVGRLRHYARARACEARRDWHGALRAFEVLDSGYRDVGWRGPFVGARWAEENGDWGQAVVAWRAWSTAVTSSEVPGDEGQDGVAESLTYAEGRLAYAEGRLAEEQGDWGAAVGAYQGLPADHRDAAARLAGARAREAEGRDAWEEVLEALEGWEEHLAEAGPMAAYARARCTFAVEDWDSAIDSFGACLPYRDAEQLALVARGRRHEAEGRWSRALAVYAEIPGELPDLAERRQRLEDLRQAAPWVDGLAAAGRVADPLATDADAADDDGGAYGALAAAGITPASSAREINDASFVLMEKGLLSPAARLAWDRLRSLAGRLRADALLYRVRQPEALQRLQQELEVCGQAETLATLSDHLPADAPLFQLLNGHRELAIRAWEERLEAAPHDVEIVHALAIACARRAMYLEEAGVYEEAEGMWRRTIACWTRWLSEDACWEGFRGERAACYGQPVTTGQLARLRRQLGQHLLDTLTARGEWQEVAGRVEKAALYRALAAAFEVEMEGARALKEVGGLHPAGDEPGARLVGGRLYLDHARLGSRLGRRIAELEAEQAADGGFDEFRTALDLALGTGVSEEGSSDITSDITPDLLFRLRATFSELGPAWILLERHQPEQALRALGERYRTRLTDLPADCEAVCGLDAAAGCPRCRRYLEHDPAYLHLPHRGARLLQDAVALAVRAHLELAQTALTTRRDGLDGAQVAWREAIAIARNAGAQVRVKRAIVRVVIGRAEVLGRERGRYRGDRLSEAIHLIDRARELIGGAGQKQLAAKAAELLTDRGVWYGSGSFEYQDLDYEKAAADLRRALELTPDSLHACDNLSRALIFHAANLLPGEDPRRAFGLFTEAIEVLHEGLVRTAGHHQLRSVLHQALSEIEERLFAELSPEELAQRIQETSGGGRPETARDPRGLQELATRQREAGDAVGALLTLIQAVRRDDHDPDLRRVLIAAVRRRA